eukprot:353590-Chlamydomonas_euryale.AAC.19
MVACLPDSAPALAGAGERRVRLGGADGPSAGHRGQLAGVPVDMAVPRAHLQLARHHEADARGG